MYVVTTNRVVEKGSPPVFSFLFFFFSYLTLHARSPTPHSLPSLDRFSTYWILSLTPSLLAFFFFLSDSFSPSLPPPSLLSSSPSYLPPPIPYPLSPLHPPPSPNKNPTPPTIHTRST